MSSSNAKSGAEEEEQMKTLPTHSNSEDGNKGVKEEETPQKCVEKEILRASENGDNDKVISMLTENKELCNVRDKDGSTPLHRACHSNKLEVVKTLLKYGADIEAKTKKLWTPLHFASHGNNHLCVSWLLTCGANANSLTRDRQTPLHLAASLKDAEKTLQILLFHRNIDATIKNRCGETALDVARRSGLYSYLFEAAEPCYNII